METPNAANLYSTADRVQKVVLHIVCAQYSTMFNSPFNQNVTGFPAEGSPVRAQLCSARVSRPLGDERESRCEVMNRDTTDPWSWIFLFLSAERSEVTAQCPDLDAPRCWVMSSESAVELCSIILHLQAQVWVQLLRLIKCPQTLSPEQQLNHTWLCVLCVCVCVR